MNNYRKRKRIKAIVVRTTLVAVKGFAENRKEKKTNFQILNLLMPKERKIRSIVGGLETSLGTTLWEPLVKELASENGFEVLNGKDLLMPPRMSPVLRATLNKVISSREEMSSTYNEKTSRESIKKACASLIKNPIPVEKFRKPPRGHGVDVWLRKNNIDYLFDSKTVQPNVGGFNRCLSQIMRWYAYYFSRYPTGNVRAFIFIPYNPYLNENFLDKTKNRGLPLVEGELRVENDLWDVCSGVTGTIDIIYSAFRYIKEKDLVKKELDKLFRQKKI